jgi:ABC-2 type transport system permease protein
MTGPAAAVPPPAAASLPAGRPAAFGPLARLTLRGLLGRRRTAGVVLLAAAPVLPAAILALGGGLGDPGTLALEVYATITLGLVIPLAALILGTGALGTEIDDGTILYLLVKPVPRRTVIVARMAVVAAASAALTVTATVVAGLLLVGGTEPALLAGMVAATLLAALLYSAVFIALSVFTGRALILGLGYVLVWEGIITSLLEGTRILSIREYALALLTAVAGGTQTEPGAGVDGLAAVVLSAVVVVLAVVLGTWRLARFEVTDTG